MSTYYQGWVPLRNWDNPSVYHNTVSRTVVFCIQSSFQTSLMVIVCYWSQGNIFAYEEFTSHILRRMLWQVWCKGELLLLELGTETVKCLWKCFRVSGPRKGRSCSCQHHDRFGHQNRFSPPSEFPLTSTWPSIFHHILGPNIYALSIPIDARSIGNSGTMPYGSSLEQNQKLHLSPLCTPNSSCCKLGRKSTQETQLHSRFWSDTTGTHVPKSEFPVET